MKLKNWKRNKWKKVMKKGPEVSVLLQESRELKTKEMFLKPVQTNKIKFNKHLSLIRLKIK